MHRIVQLHSPAGAILSMDLLLDLLRLEEATPVFSVLAFLASMPASRSMEPSRGLLEREPGGASRDMAEALEPLVGILDIVRFGLTSSEVLEPSDSVSPEMENEGLKSVRKVFSGDDIRSSKLLCIKSESKIQSFNIHC